MALEIIPADYALMYMSIATYVLPFSLLGFYNGIQWAMERLKVSQGYIKCIFRTANFRKRIKYMKPQDGFIQEKISASEIKSLECPTSAGYIYFEGKFGATPTIEYNSERTPINFLPTITDITESQAMKDSVMLRIFNLGQKMGLTDMNKIYVVTLVGAALSAIALIVLLMIVSGTIDIGTAAVQ